MNKENEVLNNKVFFIDKDGKCSVAVQPPLFGEVKLIFHDGQLKTVEQNEKTKVL